MNSVNESDETDFFSWLWLAENFNDVEPAELNALYYSDKNLIRLIPARGSESRFRCGDSVFAYEYILPGGHSVEKEFRYLADNKPEVFRIFNNMYFMKLLEYL